MDTEAIESEFIAAYVDFLLADGRDGASPDQTARLSKARAATDQQGRAVIPGQRSLAEHLLLSF
jgi:hypothetical protein